MLDLPVQRDFTAETENSGLKVKPKMLGGKECSLQGRDRTALETLFWKKKMKGGEKGDEGLNS